ncbi:hypothetical protein BN59_01288 [Legionella massiliensis]|uniref:Uncharacterized protein n=1 Tax=Legionella massiliensis TaxID=1034943 RepID=A0A078KZ08_9GAMM|nr:hypothetical protein [Legionella massiliensis]CDZ77009.1 hypothetical protein BN59_01288 [Legionella massiliensis]CEE12747.1 hypothetical protein BN1094_01288 [Legionella massiliensis]
MKLNECVHDLLEIFESEFKKKKKIYFRSAKSINTNAHVMIQQDKVIDYYGNAVHDLFVKYRSVEKHLHAEMVKWQLRETYRIVNAALASYSDSLEPIREKLKLLKAKLEATDYMVVLLHQIDSGIIPADVVCSGHGVWVKEDGEIDLTDVNNDVVVYSGLGGALKDSLGVDIENESYDPKSVVVKSTTTAKTVETIDRFPRFFGNKGPKTVPDFCLIESEKTPHPRVLEPLTGRVLFDMNDVPEVNYFSLSSVLQRFSGRTVHWAACTGVQYNGSKYPAPYSDLNWGKFKSHDSKRRKLSESEYEAIPDQPGLR